MKYANILFAWVIYLASSGPEAQKIIDGLSPFQRKHSIITQGITGLSPRFKIFVPENERDLQFRPNTRQRSWTQ